ncbi:hypothetical protein [Candidatus Berkiella aquae]|uniref:Uncharacterized protein n=1 Tax=Candidatus Berkiella aquae TaxID=295108 RepID=A0A0Q9YNT8_9GAMM|nr:hypothetical protein [Candidatus Berkiella aquae]MCS5711507.1 hypothetical protein [Candidatus Berkiella aquae]
MRFVFVPGKNKESSTLQKQIVKINKRNKIFHPVVVDMANENSVETNFTKKVVANDVIEIRAEGRPWDIGLDYESTRDFSPFSLALFLQKILANKGNIALQIELHACNSATIATGPRGDICFAKDFSGALEKLGLTQVKVVGYAGYVQSERHFKQSVVAEPERSRAKIPHCTLDEATAVYLNGKLVGAPEKILVNDYCYTEKDILSLNSLQNYFNDAEKVAMAACEQRFKELSLEFEASVEKEDSEASDEFIQFPLIYNPKLAEAAMASSSVISTVEREESCLSRAPHRF